MRDLNENNATEVVIEAMKDGSDPRLVEIMTSLVKHMHNFVREVKLTEAEWMTGIQFLTNVGKMCDEHRQEFILLSDSLGVSTLVDLINNRVPEGATEPAVLGPFYQEGAPEIQQGESIMRVEMDGTIPCLAKGRVIDTEKHPVPGALLDIWQTAPNELYESQDSNQPNMNLTGKLRTDQEGYYEFSTVKPVSYSIPADGPVGSMFNALNRQTYRPAHIHFIITAPGYKRLATQIFDVQDKFIDKDAVFSVKSSALASFTDNGNGGVNLNYDFVLVPA